MQARDNFQRWVAITPSDTIDIGETTADGAFTLKESECMGACGHGPLCLHNNHTMHAKLTPETVDKLLDEMK